VGVQEFRWVRGGTEPAGQYTVFYAKVNENHELGTGFFVHKRIISEIKRGEFVSDRTSYIIPRGRWCDIVFLKVQVPTEDIIDDIKDKFDVEVEHAFDKFPKCNIRILLGYFIGKVGRKDIFIPTIPNECLHKSSSNNNNNNNNNNNIIIIIIIIIIIMELE
jgi:hypothetical protein